MIDIGGREPRVENIGSSNKLLFKTFSEAGNHFLCAEHLWVDWVQRIVEMDPTDLQICNLSANWRADVMAPSGDNSVRSVLHIPVAT